MPVFVDEGNYIIWAKQLLTQGAYFITLTDGKKSLEQEREIIMKSVKKEIVDLVIATSEKVLGEQVDNKYKDKVVKELGNL
jgi:F0F1-type ATP synthase membrane subunit b/b'